MLFSTDNLGAFIECHWLSDTDTVTFQKVLKPSPMIPCCGKQSIFYRLFVFINP